MPIIIPLRDSTPRLTLVLDGDERPKAGEWLEFADPATGKVEHVQLTAWHVSIEEQSLDVFVSARGKTWETSPAYATAGIPARVVSAAQVKGHRDGPQAPEAVADADDAGSGGGATVVEVEVDVDKATNVS